MPIKINGTTILDEANFADKDLSNLSASGETVINNVVSSAISGMTYMKNVDTKNPTSFSLNTTQSFVAPKNGWVILNTAAYVGPFYDSQSGVSILNAGASFPVCKDTAIWNKIGSVTGAFFPEID